MSDNRFFQKAQNDLRAAELLLEKNLPDSDCNRAYYAMHNAARSALIAVGQDEAAASKTHAGLLSAFSLHVVKPGLVDASLSSAIAQEERRRLLADYDIQETSREDVREATLNAGQFVEAIAALLASRT